MRERVEDLGRLAVMLENCLDNTMLNEWRSQHLRAKDFLSWFEARTEIEKKEIIHSWGYDIEKLLFDIHEMLLIAQGSDEMNEDV